MRDSSPKIEITNLVKIYGKVPHHALKLFRQGRNRDEILKATGNVLGVANVSISIAEGELFVIMGLSGSGKSTLVRCINRLIEPTSGQIFIDNEDIVQATQKRLREIRRTKISMVFQRFGLFPHKTVLQNAEYGLKMRGIPPKQRRDKAREILNIVGLDQWIDQLPSALSGGMQQRVGLARALATEAPILLMDEAFSALDPLIRREMQDELMRLQKELRRTIVFISHDIQEALKIGDRVAIMKDGYLVQVGTPEEIITHPVDDYIVSFTQDVNRAQVIRAGSIRRPTLPVAMEETSVIEALDIIKDQQRKRMYVVDNDKKPVGILTLNELEKAAKTEVNTLEKVMKTEFPVVETETHLEDLFHLAKFGIPIAVVNRKGQFKGIVEPSDLFASLTAEKSEHF